MTRVTPGMPTTAGMPYPRATDVMGVDLKNGWQEVETSVPEIRRKVEQDSLCRAPVSTPRGLA
jgi:hypothetical protein